MLSLLQTLFRLSLIASFLLVQARAADVIISQYIETNSGTAPKGIEIWNISGSSIDFSTKNLVVEQGTNGGAFSTVVTVSSGTLAANAVWVIGTDPELTTNTDYNFAFNGDDSLRIKLDGVVQDVFGNPGSDPGSEWSGSGVSTKNQNIQLKSGVSTGDTDGWTDPSTRFETVSTNPVADTTGFGSAPAGGGNDSDTSLDDPGSQPAAANFSSVADTSGEAIDVFKFRINDQGTADGLASKVTKVRVTPHSSNTADWTDSIQGVTLNDGSAVTIASTDITDTYIDINITSGNLDVSDGTSKTVTLAVYLNTSNIIDGNILSFAIDTESHDWSVDASGSAIAADAGTDFNSNNFTLAVVATDVTFTTQPPSTVTVNTDGDPTVVVKFVDANGNFDTGNTSTVTITTSGVNLSGTTAVAATAGVSSFTDLKFTTNQSNITLTATSGGFTDVSNTFTVANFDFNSPTTLTEGDIAIVRYSQGNDATYGDGFTFYTLADIGAGTEIYFTDNGWKANDTWRANEGVIKWMAPSGGLAAGSLVSIDSGSGGASFTSSNPSTYPTNWHWVSGTLAPNTTADSIIVFQTTNANGTDGNASTDTWNDPSNTNFISVFLHDTGFDADSTSSTTTTNPLSGATYGIVVQIEEDGAAPYNDAQVYTMYRTLDNGTKADVWTALTTGTSASDRTYWNSSSSYIAPTPVVTTDDATNIAGVTATLNGNVDTVDAGSVNDAAIYFTYGTDPNLLTGTTIVTAVQTNDSSGNTAIVTGSESNADNNAGNDSNETFTYNISGLSEGTTYYFRATAIKNDDGTVGDDDGDDIIGQSNIKSWTTFTTPSAPPILVATNMTSTSFQANWNTDANATSYKLDIATDKNFGSMNLNDSDEGANTSKNNTSLDLLNNTYFYRSRSHNAAGTSGNSDVVIVYGFAVDAKGSEDYKDVLFSPRFGGTRSLAELFGANGSVQSELSGMNATSCSNIIVYDATSKTSKVYYHNASNTQWEESAASGVDASSTSFGAGTAFVVRSRESSSWNLFMTGVVRSSQPAVTIKPGYNMLGTGLSGSTTLDQLNLNVGTDFQGGTSPSSSDRLTIIESDGSRTNYWYASGFGADDGWYKNFTKMTPSSITIPAGGVIFLNSRQGSDWNWTLPSE